MEFDSNDITILETLNIHEAKAYIKFLESERRRHKKDVDDIDKKIQEVKKKFKC